MIRTGLFLIALFLLEVNACAQPYRLLLHIRNQPDNYIVLSSIKGDDLTPVDSTTAINGKVQFTLGQHTHPGVYRLDLGHSTYSRLMNEPKHHLILIFNNENIELKTDFKAPLDSVQVIKSEENKVWFAFSQFEKNYIRQFGILEKEVDFFWSANDTAKAFAKSNEFNRLQMGRDLYIGKTSQQNHGLFASKLIRLYRDPVLDGYLTPEERKEVYKSEYFKTIDFSDEQLINSSGYTDKVFQYLVAYNSPELTKEEREAAYKKAIDILLAQINKNPKVDHFIREYLKHGFEVLEMKNLVRYIEEKHN